MNHNLRKQSIKNKLFIHSVKIHKDFFEYIKAMDYELLEKMKVEELTNYLKMRGLKATGRKKELVAWVFAASKNGVQPVKNSGRNRIRFNYWLQKQT